MRICHKEALFLPSTKSHSICMILQSSSPQFVSVLHYNLWQIFLEQSIVDVVALVYYVVWAWKVKKTKRNSIISVNWTDEELRNYSERKFYIWILFTTEINGSMLSLLTVLVFLNSHHKSHCNKYYTIVHCDMMSHVKHDLRCQPPL